MTAHFVDSRPLVEMMPVADVYASGIGKVEMIDRTCVRLTFYIMQDGERVIVAKIIRPVAELMADMLPLMVRDAQAAATSNSLAVSAH